MSNETNDDDTAARRIAAAAEQAGLSADDAELYLSPIADDPERVVATAASLAAYRRVQAQRPNPAQGRRGDKGHVGPEQAFTAFFSDAFNR